MGRLHLAQDTGIRGVGGVLNRAMIFRFREVMLICAVAEGSLTS